jgi:membrane protease YdiL (CAAX protease family)
LSAWDAFHRAVPALQREGKYEFLTTRESLGDLMTAPFETEFLGRKTTWVSLAFTGLAAGLVVASRDPGVEYEPFRPRDAAFTGALSYNAAVGEEAVFRGWLLPMLNQNTGQRFWLANAIQAGIFGALHPDAGAYAPVIAASALYDGWVTRRNDWSIRESIFQHFWYDVAVVAATLLTDERQGRIQVTLPTIRF